MGKVKILYYYLKILYYFGDKSYDRKITDFILCRVLLKIVLFYYEILLTNLLNEIQ